MTTDTTDTLIRRHRTADAAVTILGPDGPLAGREVVVEQRSHAFRFGCTGFDEIALANHELDDAAAERAERVATDWLDLYTFATLPFYWGRFEPTRGQPDTQRLLTAARWFVERGCRVKGHPLCWHSVSADWLLELTDDEIVDAQLGADPPRRRGVRGGDRHLGRDQRSRDHADLRQVRQRDLAHVAQARTRRNRQGHLRRRAGGQSRRHAPPQRLRHVRRLRASRQGLPRGGHPDRCTGAPVAHAPGLLGRGEDRGRPRSVRTVRAAHPLHGEHARVRTAHAARDRRSQRLPGRRVAEHARRRSPPGRRDRPALSDPARASGRRGDHVVGLRRWRLAERADRSHPDRWEPEARLRRPPRPDQGCLVAAADAVDDRRRRNCPVQRLPRRVRAVEWHGRGDVPNRDRRARSPSTSASATPGPGQASRGATGAVPSACPVGAGSSPGRGVDPARSPRPSRRSFGGSNRCPWRSSPSTG